MAGYSNGSMAGRSNISLTEKYGEYRDYPKSLHVGLHVIGIPLGIAIVVGNVLLMVVFKSNHRNPQKSFKSKTTVILTSLSLGETLAGLVLLVDVGLYSAFDDGNGYSTNGCYFWNIVKLVPLLGGFLHLTALGVERYIIVNQTPHHPHMKRLVMVLCLLWVYGFLVGILAFAFTKAVRGDRYICDVLIISAVYVTAIAFLHVLVCVIACTALVLVVRNIVKLHQQKIQVSNTITYHNMLDDARSALLFYIVLVVSFLLWLPFLMCEIFLLSGVQSENTETATLWAFLLGHLVYTKCYWYMIANKNLRADIKRTFSKAEKRPVRMGTARGRVG